MGRYWKFIVAVVGALAVIGAQLPPDAPGWLAGFFAVVTAVSVYLVPNEPEPPVTARR